MTNDTAPVDPFMVAFSRIAKDAVADAVREGRAWWEPGDGQLASTFRTDDGWLVLLIGDRELTRVPMSALQDMADNIRASRN